MRSTCARKERVMAKRKLEVVVISRGSGRGRLIDELTMIERPPGSNLDAAINLVIEQLEERSLIVANRFYEMLKEIRDRAIDFEGSLAPGELPVVWSEFIAELVVQCESRLPMRDDR